MGRELTGRRSIPAVDGHVHSTGIKQAAVLLMAFNSLILARLFELLGVLGVLGERAVSWVGWVSRRDRQERKD